MTSGPELDNLRRQFCDAAKRGDVAGMKPYLDNEFIEDEARGGVLMMAFTAAIKGSQPAALDLLLDYTLAAEMGPPILYALATSAGGETGLKLYQSAAAKRQP